MGFCDFGPPGNVVRMAVAACLWPTTFQIPSVAQTHVHAKVWFDYTRNVKSSHLKSSSSNYIRPKNQVLAQTQNPQNSSFWLSEREIGGGFGIPEQNPKG